MANDHQVHHACRRRPELAHRFRHERANHRSGQLELHSHLETAPAVPAGPTNLTASVISSTQINLAWTDNATDEGGYQIERLSGAGTFTSIASVGPNVTTYSNTGLTPGTSYWYRVRAANANGISTPSNVVTARTSGGGSPTPFSGVPSAIPGTIQAEDFDNGGQGVAYLDGSTGNLGRAYRTTDVDIDSTTDTGGGYYVGWMRAGEWLLYSVNVATAGTYTLEARVASSGLGGTFHVEANGVNVSGTMSVPDTGGWQAWQTITKPVTLTAGTQSIRIVLDTIGPSGAVCNLNFVRFISAGPTVPVAPTDLTATAVSSTEINLAWTDNASNETGFAIERSPDGTTFAPLTTVGANVTSYQNTGLTASTTYHYRVRATNEVGPSAWSNVANAQTTGTGPAPPTNLIAMAVSSTQINLTWTDNASNETGFAIERSPDGTTFAPLTTVGANVTSYQNTGLTASTTYHYRVRATNEVGPSAWSNVANAQTTGTGPAAPTNLTATAVSSSRINLAWIDNATNETGFAIERSLDGATFTPLTTVGANVTTYANTGLAVATTYYYRVRATNAAGPSAWSNVANAQTAERGAALAIEFDGDRRIEQPDRFDVDRSIDERDGVRDRTVDERERVFRAGHGWAEHYNVFGHWPGGVHQVLLPGAGDECGRRVGLDERGECEDEEIAPSCQPPA